MTTVNSCTCKDYRFRSLKDPKHVCKHMKLVRELEVRLCQ